MKTLLEITLQSAEYLAKKGIERSRREAEELIADVLGLKRLDLYLQFERPLQENELEKCREALLRRSKREPTAYIAGKVEFAGVSIEVNGDVLIPRQETELLVEKIVQTLSTLPYQGKVLWDMCTGSGCIGIALKKRLPELQVVLTDRSSKALEVAKKNAQQNGVEVLFYQGDLFEPLEGQKCDFFVCNPPYISEKEYVLLSPEVKDYEPKQALLAGPSGLEFYAQIANKLLNFLEKEGKGWLEIGFEQGEKVLQLFKPAYRCHYEKDWAGHDRFFFLERDLEIPVS